MAKKKLLAPIIIVAVIVLQNLAVVYVSLITPIPNFVKIFIVVFAVIVTIIFIVKLVERFKEIKVDEEDDISKY